MEYVPVLLAFGAGLVALVGNTWDSTKSGFRKLTKPGRYAIALIVFSLIYSGISTYQQRDQKQGEIAEKKKLDGIIKFEIARSAENLLSPFRDLYRENRGGEYLKDNQITIAMMLDERMLKAAQDTCFDIHPKSIWSPINDAVWHEIFRAGIKLGMTRIDHLVNQYGTKMNADLLAALHDLQTNNYFSGYANPSIENSSGCTAKDERCKDLRCVFRLPDGSHKEFLNMVLKVETLSQTEAIVR